MSLDIYFTYTIDGNEWEPFSANITHNLSEMAKESGIYEQLWYSEGLTPKDIEDDLSEGLLRLEADPEHYRQFDAENGWGTYDDFVPFVEEVLEACQKYPNAVVHISR